jgi:hypothetical protein
VFNQPSPLKTENGFNRILSISGPLGCKQDIFSRGITAVPNATLNVDDSLAAVLLVNFPSIPVAQRFDTDSLIGSAIATSFSPRNAEALPRVPPSDAPFPSGHA